MNLEEYIASGILENYLLGNCSPQEKQEVECMSHIYPEIKAELEALELSMEAYFVSQSVSPPADLWDSIDAELAVQTTSEDKKGDVADKPVVPIRSLRSIYIVSSIAAILVLGFFLYTENLTNSALSTQLSEVKSELSEIEQNNIELNNELSKTLTLIASVTSPDIIGVQLKGLETKIPDVNAFVAWNPVKETVIINRGNLPKNPDNKQYQLWAIVDGAPVDLGVFDVNPEHFILEMKSVSGAAAFAITLEDRGGKPTPNLEELYVIGQVS